MSASAGLPLPPGRLGLPWLGETMSILRSNHGFHRDRVARYGPIYKTRLLGSPFVVFSGHEAFHTFATDPRIRRGDADALPTRQIFRNSVALYDGGDQVVRKGVMLAALWDRDAIGSYLGRMQRLLEESVDDWARSGRVTLRHELELWADRFAGAVITGDTSEAHAVELHHVITDMQGAFMAPPFPIPGTTYGRAIKARDRLAVIVEDAIDRHRSGGLGRRDLPDARRGGRGGSAGGVGRRRHQSPHVHGPARLLGSVACSRPWRWPNTPRSGNEPGPRSWRSRRRGP